MTPAGNLSLKYNQAFLGITNDLIHAFRNSSHEELEATFIKWNEIYKNAMADGFQFWAGRALSEFQDRLEDAVMQHSYKGSYFAHRAITKHGIVTPNILNLFMRFFDKDAPAKEALVMNMINNGSYFSPGNYHRYIQDIGSILYYLIKGNDDHLAAKLFEKIIPGINRWYEFRNIVVKSLGYIDPNKDDAIYREIVKASYDEIMSYSPSDEEVRRDDEFNTREILFLYRNGFGRVAETCLTHTNRVHWFSDLIEIEEYRKIPYEKDFLEKISRKSSASLLGYLFATYEVDISRHDFTDFEPADFVLALEQVAQSDIYLDINKVVSIFTERFKSSSDIELLIDRAIKRKLQDHPILMAIPQYNRIRLNHDLSM